MSLEITKTKALEFCKSYSTANALLVTPAPSTTSTPPTIDDLAQAIAAHFSPAKFASFTFGTTTLFVDAADNLSKIKGHLTNLAKHGLGHDVRMERCRVEPVSAGNAICFITWSYNPPQERGIEAWEFENVYSYRVPVGMDGQVVEGEKGYWEFAVSDNEIGGLIRRVPEFLEGLQSPSA